MEKEQVIKLIDSLVRTGNMDTINRILLAIDVVEAEKLMAILRGLDLIDVMILRERIWKELGLYEE
jgi:hypothetical protein